MNVLEGIDQPTLLIDELVARRNIQRMVDRATKNGVSFRPHFKTHQSAKVGEWFSEAGVKKITVSSVEMGEYFAAHGWKDILVAFSMNLRQVERINTLAENIHLEVLVENHEALHALARNGHAPLGVWIKVDVGNRRTGLDWKDVRGIKVLIDRIHDNPRLQLLGLLTHSGHTYLAGGQDEVTRVFREGVERLTILRGELETLGIGGMRISVGDTPGCSLCEDWSGIDEIRPGNFVFYDAQQAIEGSCQFEDISVALVCPVVAKHPERREVVIYGGAIHLSKDTLTIEGHKSYGVPVMQKGDRWGAPIFGGWVDRLSQEHGIVNIPGIEFDQVAVGDLLFVIPAHSCLTVQVMGEYMTLNGERISTLNKSRGDEN